MSQWKERDMEEDCKDCMKKIAVKMEENCEACGPELREEEGEIVLVGMDAVALFPSMSGKETGKIVRKRIKDSNVKIEGFNWRKAAVYIKINRGMLSKSGTEREVFKFLPFRKSNRGVQPKMGSTGMKAEIGSEKTQWIFPNKNPSDTIKKEMMGMVAKIAILVLWSNRGA